MWPVSWVQSLCQHQSTIGHVYGNLVYTTKLPAFLQSSKNTKLISKGWVCLRSFGCLIVKYHLLFNICLHHKIAGFVCCRKDSMACRKLYFSMHVQMYCKCKMSKSIISCLCLYSQKFLTLVSILSKKSSLKLKPISLVYILLNFLSWISSKLLDSILHNPFCTNT